MTDEEAIKVLRSLYNVQRLDTLTQEEMTSVAMAIKALEQKPCEDAISQKIDEFKVKGKTAEVWIVKGKLQIRCLGVIHNFSLPSVTPKEKTGKWIMHPKGIYAHLVCNKCLSSAPYNCQTNYCPNCGARMTESEDKK